MTHLEPLMGYPGDISVGEIVKNALEDLKVLEDVGYDAVLIENKLANVRESAGDLPVVTGSGATKENLNILLRYADIVIVGTSINEGSSGTKEEHTNLKPYEMRLSKERSLQFCEKFDSERHISSTFEVI